MGTSEANFAVAAYIRDMLGGVSNRPVNLTIAKAELRARGLSLEEIELERLILHEANLSGRAVEFGSSTVPTS